MRTIVKEKQRLREKRAYRVRRNLHGTEARPRLCVRKSNKHIQVQMIDDQSGKTLGSAASFEKTYRDTEFGGRNKAAARKLGERIAQIAKEKNIKEVIFDRGPFKYHGILAELADAARKAGLQF